MINVKYFDFHLNGKNPDTDLALINEAKRLGYQGISIFYSNEHYKSALENFNKIINDETAPPHPKSFKIDEFSITPGIIIQGKNPQHLQKQIRSLRNKTNILMVDGGDLKINRAACENVKVDILSRPYYKRRDCGINHVLSREAAKNNVAIELCFSDLLKSRNSLRSKIMAHFRDIIKLQRKFQFLLLITSGARTVYDLRTPRDIMALYSCLGLKKEEILRAISDSPSFILDYNQQRKNMVVNGVKIINEK